MELEYAAHDRKPEMVYPFGLDAAGDTLSIDWTPLVRGVLADLGRQVEVSHIAAAFHHTLAEMLVEVARRLGEERVVLSGGCFQNRYLTECAVTRLRTAGFRPYWQGRVPPNDGGVALGQVAAVLRSQPTSHEETV
jgi:hydrogenase maturation protein HypF